MAFTLLLATVLCCVFGAQMLRGASRGGAVELIGFNGSGVLVLFAIFVAATSFWGSIFAASLIVALLLHEAGHVISVRQIGDGRARLRLAPINYATPLRDTEPQSDAEILYVALMGAGFSLIPMVAALGTALLVKPVLPGLHEFLLILGATIGALNFIMLLPFGPLDGGICARIATRNFWPAFGQGATVFMVAALAAAGMRQGSLALIILALFGLYSLFAKSKETRRPMSPHQGLVGLAAYSMTLAAHFTAGWLLFDLVV